MFYVIRLQLQLYELYSFVKNSRNNFVDHGTRIGRRLQANQAPLSAAVTLQLQKAYLRWATRIVKAFEENYLVCIDWASRGPTRRKGNQADGSQWWEHVPCSVSIFYQLWIFMIQTYWITLSQFMVQFWDVWGTFTGGFPQKTTKRLLSLTTHTPLIQGVKCHPLS